ncbi:MAG TPA: hypothetical protein PKD20_01030 [Candidatus Saccharibacteria bacterium]|nr:hypothetical protein [Candidatus Saccharibacteria bacterium]HMT55439.1 hypothetical protein [Candidatus Saccharibacteria bacterium]
MHTPKTQPYAPQISPHERDLHDGGLSFGDFVRTSESTSGHFIVARSDMPGLAQLKERTTQINPDRLPEYQREKLFLREE